MTGRPGAPKPFLADLRGQGCLVKGVLVVVLLVVGSPLIGIAMAAAWTIAQELGVLVVGGGLAWLAGWFLFTNGQRAPGTPPVIAGAPGPGSTHYRYCASCGEIHALDVCPECGRHWREPEHLAVEELAAVLNDLTAMVNDGRLDRRTYDIVRAVYERRLLVARPPRSFTAPAEAPPPGLVHRPVSAPPLSAAGPSRAATAPPEAPTFHLPPPLPAPPPAPSSPPKPPGPNMGEVAIGWAAERQADLLLYAGAFLLSIAAVIFVAYQGETLSGSVRFAVLTTYAVAFLTMGLTLSRWERVREAGPVFLALGAILVPVDFVALRTQVLHDDVPLDALWLLGSVSTAALYLALAFRGYGRLYFAPGGLAVVVAWTALGATLDVPWQWLGPWFAAFAAVAYVAAQALMARWRGLAWVLGAAIAIGLGSLAWAQVSVADPDYAEWALPLTYALILAAVAIGLRWRENEVTFAVLPPLATMVLASAWWAASGMPDEWKPAWVAVAANGYLAIAHLRAKGRERAWAAVGGVLALLSLPPAHGLAIQDGASHAALPATYGLVLAGLASAYLRWRWVEAAALLPAVAAALGGTAWWGAWGLPDEWKPLWISAAAAGYLALAHFEGRGRERAWAAVALVAGVLPVLMAHGLTTQDGANRAPLPIAYAALFAGLSSAYGRWRWVVAAALLPPVGMLAVASTWWAADGVFAEWYATFVAGAALGYLALARFDRSGRRAAWQWACAATGALAVAMSAVTPAFDDPNRWAMSAPSAVLLVGAFAAFATWRWQWRLAPGVIPALTAMAGGSAAWARWDLAPEWYGCFAAAAAGGYLLLAFADTATFRRTWTSLAFMAAVGAACITQALVIADHDASRWALPATYGAAALVALAAAMRWRWRLREAVALAPPLVAAFGASLLWAWIDMPRDWLAAWGAGIAASYAFLAPFDARGAGLGWRNAGLLVGLAATCFAHSFAVSPIDDPVRAQLPVMYGVLLAASAWDAFRWRDLGMLLTPVLAALAAGATLWAARLDAEWWPYPALAIAAGLLLASPWWQREKGLGAFGWGYTVLFAVLPTLIALPHNVHHSAHGLATQVVTAGLLGTAAFLTRGGLTVLATAERSPLASRAERAALIQASAAFLFGAAASTNQLLEVDGGNQAWAFIALGAAGWATTAAFGRRMEWFWTFAPIGLSGSIIAAFIAGDDFGVLTAVLAIATAGQLTAAFGARRWALLGPASAFAWLTVWAGWQWRDFDDVYLSAVYLAVAAAEWAGFMAARRRLGPSTESGGVVLFLSWSTWAVAAVAAGFVLGQRSDELRAGENIVTTREWTLAAAVIAMSSAAVVAEGLRLGKRWIWTGASAGLVVALLMAIATREPSNVQAYTAPIGVYLIAMALTWLRSPAIIEGNLAAHEAVMLLGAFFLILPPAEQSFDPGGGKYGLELIGIGVMLLLVGLGLHARWLVAAALLTMTATAGRLVTGGYFAVPYWALLGLAGTALIGAGLLILSQRAAWDRFRLAVVEWWRTAAPGST